MRIKPGYFFILITISAVIAGCKQDTSYRETSKNPEILHQTVKSLTDIIVHDIFSPPVASRIYAYPNIAAYEILRYDYPEYQSMVGQLHGLETLPEPDTSKEINFPLAAIQSFITVSRTKVFSEDKLDAVEKEALEYFKELGIPAGVFKRSQEYGNEVAEAVIAWSDKDNYKQTRTFPRYTVTDDPDRWTPTPPDYMDGIEPHWNKIRTFVIDSATQFIPIRPTSYDMDTTSTFFKEVMQVYDVGKNLSPEQKAIAEFWDCNPFVTHHQGHVMFATKKITPGGHWIGITKIACEKLDADIMKSSEAYAKTSIALADAFISCWDEKYRSVLVRPETVINQHIDEEWRPLLQTPPFPEYTSGHSVISSAAAVTLTDIFGEPFQFVDSTEVEYGLPPRTFNSFMEASAEAAISRLYGGIHYMPACVNGVEQGKKVGNYVVAHLKTDQSEE